MTYLISRLPNDSDLYTVDGGTAFYRWKDRTLKLVLVDLGKQDRALALKEYLRNNKECKDVWSCKTDRKIVWKFM